MQSNMKRILIIDDHKMFLDGIQSLLSNDSEFHVQIINNYVNDHKKIDLKIIDLVLLDINMPDINGIELVRELKKKASHLKVIFLTSHNEAAIVKKAMKANPDGYLLKNTDKIELKTAIRKVLEGNKYFNKQLEEIIYAVNTDIINLSKREKEVLKLIAEEKTTLEISKSLFVSVNTIETHRKNLIRKTGSKNVVGLIKYAINNNLL